MCMHLFSQWLDIIHFMSQNMRKLFNKNIFILLFGLTKINKIEDIRNSVTYSLIYSYF